MLRSGKSTPRFVDEMLSVFGKNPHGEPNNRLIWSERKMIYFAGEQCPEYAYLGDPCWILEVWTDPEKDAGPPELWQSTTFGLMGPYPRQGTYNFVKQFPADWLPTEDAVRLICVGLVESRDFTMKERADGIRAAKEADAAAARQKVAEEIVELQDSASRGLITQPVSGQKNNFRTTDDWERDLARSIPAGMPAKGGKLY